MSVCACVCVCLCLCLCLCLRICVCARLISLPPLPPLLFSVCDILCQFCAHGHDVVLEDVEEVEERLGEEHIGVAVDEPLQIAL